MSTIINGGYHYIRINGRTIAIHSDDDQPSEQSVTTRYLHRDHLGSVTTLTDENSTIIENMSYDAYARRRDATDWDGIATAIEARGYTGHEHLDNVGLIHMNGRVYDPNTGRMLSADPFVPNPLNGQSWNRYTYVLNNPLGYTDPSGFEPDDGPTANGCIQNPGLGPKCQGNNPNKIITGDALYWFFRQFAEATGQYNYGHAGYSGNNNGDRTYTGLATGSMGDVAGKDGSANLDASVCVEEGFSCIADPIQEKYEFIISDQIILGEVKNPISNLIESILYALSNVIRGGFSFKFEQDKTYIVTNVGLYGIREIGYVTVTFNGKPFGGFNYRNLLTDRFIEIPYGNPYRRSGDWDTLTMTRFPNVIDWSSNVGYSIPESNIQRYPFQ